jgi:hypothetical protein
MSSRKDRFKLFYISFCKIKSNQKIFNSLVRALAKNSSFGFLSVGLCVRKNPMCHLRVGFFTLTDNEKRLAKGGNL